VNPEWGYWHRMWSKIPPTHPGFVWMNHLAWSLELIAAGLMLIPGTRFLGGVIIIGSFLFIATQVRLGLLTEMVMLAGLLFAVQGTYGQQFLDQWSWPGTGEPAPAVGSAFALGVGVLLVCYLVLLPFAHFGLFWNFYSGKRLPLFLQRALEQFTNTFGIII